MRLKELSDLLGLSPTTVSRALNGYPEVSEKTRARVAEAARLNNYAPSQAARGLATGRVGAIGHIVPLGEHQMLNPHFSDFIAGAGQTFAKLEIDILLSVAQASNEIEAYHRLVRANRVDGFVVPGPLVEDPRIDLLLDLGVPFVVHGRIAGSLDQTEAPYSWLDVNSRGAFERATRYLIDLGHREIALLNGFEKMNFAYLRRKGFEDAMTAAQLPVRDSFLFSRDMTEPYGFEVMLDLMGRDNRPTAVLTASKLVASGALRAIGELGLRLGQDVSIITFDDRIASLGAHPAVPTLSCVRSSLFEAGARVAEIITDLIKSPEQPPIHELWDAELIVGRSTGPVPC